MDNAVVIKLRKQMLFLALTILFSVGILQREILQTVASDPAIYIDGNGQLAAFATGGDGTKKTPYLIANYTIATASSHGVEIRNTTKYFILRNVTVDGTGSNEKYGFYFTNVTNGIIENNKASHWTDGFYLESSRNNTLAGNTASNNNNNGFYLGSSSNFTTLTGNAASNNYHGFQLLESSNNTLTGNTASTNNETGFRLQRSSNNTLTDNTASNNSEQGFHLRQSSNFNTLSGNTATNSSYNGFYLDYSSNNTLSSNTATNNSRNGFYLDYSSNNTLTSNTATNNSGYGFQLRSSSHNTLTGNIASNNSHGIVLDFSSNSNTLTGNAACNNSESGIAILESSNFNTLIGNTASYNKMGFSPRYSSNFNTLTGNTANNNSYYGFWLDTSSRNMLTSNTANNNKGGFWLVPSSNFNSLTGNTASNNSMNGFYLGSSNNNGLTGNTASHNSNGFYMWQSSSNLFYCNSIRLNAVQASSSSTNTWHNGTHGNYWSDYVGSDRNNDSIGDTPYSITGEGNNEDPYPLMFDPVRNLYRPSAPQNLVGTAGEGFVELMWTAPTVDGGSTITEYHIYRSTFSGFGYTQIGSSLATSFTDTTVSNGTTYFYVIRAVNAVGESPASNEVITTAPATVPTAPQLLQATAGEGIVELTWTAPTSDGGSSITTYHIYRSTSSGVGYTQIGSSPTTSFTDTTVSNEVTYYYVVRAINVVGESPDSNEVTAATPPIPTTASKINSFSGVFFLFGLISLSLSVLYIRRRNNK